MVDLQEVEGRITRGGHVQGPIKVNDHVIKNFLIRASINARRMILPLAKSYYT